MTQCLQEINSMGKKGGATPTRQETWQASQCANLFRSQVTPTNCGKILWQWGKSEHESMFISGSGNFGILKSIILCNDLTSKLNVFLACMFRIPKIKVANSTCQLPIWAISVSSQLMWSKSNKCINEQTKTGKVNVLQKNPHNPN